MYLLPPLLVLILQLNGAGKVACCGSIGKCSVGVSLEVDVVGATATCSVNAVGCTRKKVRILGFFFNMMLEGCSTTVRSPFGRWDRVRLCLDRRVVTTLSFYGRVEGK